MGHVVQRRPQHVMRALGGKGEGGEEGGERRGEERRGVVQTLGTVSWAGDDWGERLLHSNSSGGREGGRGGTCVCIVEVVRADEE